MKKKILILSLCANIIAVVFVFMAFKEKALNTDSKHYIVMNVTNGGEMLVSDDENTIADIHMKYPWTEKEVRRNEQIISKEINDLAGKGYELVSSNGDHNESNYIFEKK